MTHQIAELLKLQLALRLYNYDSQTVVSTSISKPEILKLSKIRIRPMDNLWVQSPYWTHCPHVLSRWSPKESFLSRTTNRYSDDYRRRTYPRPKSRGVNIVNIETFDLFYDKKWSERLLWEVYSTYAMRFTDQTNTNGFRCSSNGLTWARSKSSTIEDMNQPTHIEEKTNVIWSSKSTLHSDSICLNLSQKK